MTENGFGKLRLFQIDCIPVERITGSCLLSEGGGLPQGVRLLHSSIRGENSIRNREE